MLLSSTSIIVVCFYVQIVFSSLASFVEVFFSSSLGLQRADALMSSSETGLALRAHCCDVLVVWDVWAADLDCRDESARRFGDGLLLRQRNSTQVSSTPDASRHCKQPWSSCWSSSPCCILSPWPCSSSPRWKGWVTLERGEIIHISALFDFLSQYFLPLLGSWKIVVQTLTN